MMSDAHASDTPMIREPNGVGEQGDADRHDDHGHAEESLGPIDWPAWAAGGIGVLLGLAVAWCFVLADVGLPVA